MYVLDSSAIIAGINVPPEQGITVQGVVEEVHMHSSHMILYSVLVPEKNWIEKVKITAKKTGDLEVLSATDIALLALAAQEHAILITDDYAMQNVAKAMGIEYISAQMRGIKEKRKWKWRCASCGRYYRKKYDECPVCGGRLRRVRER
ncbi:MAG: DNA-binding protein [Euryarchaeota archaeon]|nr:DNA-binding protein [Euryarchaeota archaeon]